MNWSLYPALQEGCLFLHRHPEILLSVLAFLSLWLFRLMSKNGGGIAVNWPVVGMLPTIIANNDRLLDHVVDILRARDHSFMFYGPWFSGMNFLVTCDPRDANHMFNVHFDNYPKGDEFLEIFDVLGEGIFRVDGESWAAQRRMAHAQMSHQRYRASVGERTRDKVANVLLPLLGHMSESDVAVDLGEIFMRFTFDTTCALVLGVDPGCLAAELPTIPFAKALDQVEEVLLFRHIVPMVWWKLLRRLGAGKERKMAEASEAVDRFIGQCIRDRRESREMDGGGDQGGPVDLLTPYMDCADDKFLRDTLLTFLGAGKDTTGAALVWLFWLVANHPGVEKNILEELRRLRPRDNGDDEMTVFDAEETDALVYLQAVVCETLRLYPPVPFNHKGARKADVLPSGHRVRPGMNVVFCMYAVGRMEGIWGEDCLEFKPERWITGSGTLRHEPSYKFIAFHSGPRSCLGKGMAFTQMRVIAAALLYNFSVRVVEGHVVEPKLSIVIQTKNGLLVKLKKRKNRGY